MTRHRVLVCLNLLELRQIVDRNVLVTANALRIWLALIINVEIHVPELAE